jgi:ATP-dependent DNA ligase
MDWSPPRPALRPVAFVEPCISTTARQPHAGPAWLHEIKHDGYRMMVWRDGERVRLFTRRGYDWSDRYPLIAGAARQLRATRFLIDGEAVVCGPDGVADFARLYSRERDASVFLYAFDLLVVDGTDIRGERLDDRRAKLRQLLVRPDDTTPQAPQHEAADARPWFRQIFCGAGLGAGRRIAYGSSAEGTGSQAG